MILPAKKEASIKTATGDPTRVLWMIHIVVPSIISNRNGLSSFLKLAYVKHVVARKANRFTGCWYVINNSIIFNSRKRIIIFSKANFLATNIFPAPRKAINDAVS